MKKSKLISRIFFLSIVMILSQSCTDDDTDSSSNPSNNEISSYDIDIEGEGNFSNTRESYDSNLFVSGSWYQNPDDENKEELLVNIEDNEATSDLSLTGTIVLQNGTAMDFGDNSDEDSDELAGSIFLIDLSDKLYASKSGTVTISNLKIDSESIPEEENASLASFNVEFNGDFDIVGTFEEEESINISGSIEVSSELLDLQ